MAGDEDFLKVEFRQLRSIKSVSELRKQQKKGYEAKTNLHSIKFQKYEDILQKTKSDLTKKYSQLS